MSDSISRQDAIRWVKTECNPYGKPTLDFESGVKVIEHLKQMPSAERTGYWIYKTTDAYIQRICSACGWSERIYHRNRNQDGLIRNYCPNCGVKMEREKE